MAYRYQSPIGVGELMHFFDATHTSVNALPMLAPGNEEQHTTKHVKKVRTEPQAPSQIASSKVTRFGPIAC